jgi:hypothetical protein
MAGTTTNVSAEPSTIIARSRSLAAAKHGRAILEY